MLTSNDTTDCDGGGEAICAVCGEWRPDFYPLPLCESRHFSARSFASRIPDKFQTVKSFFFTKSPSITSQDLFPGNDWIFPPSRSSSRSMDSSPGGHGHVAFLQNGCHCHRMGVRGRPQVTELQTRRERALLGLSLLWHREIQVVMNVKADGNIFRLWLM